MIGKKTIWIPVLIGIVSGSLILSAALADFFIPLGEDTSIGIGELFTTLSAALGGPVAVILTLLVPYSGVILLNLELYTEPRSLYIALADAAAHFSAMLVVAIIYYRILYPWARKTGAFLAGWFLLVGVYYYLAFLPLEVVFVNLADPDFGVTYPFYARNLFPEFLGTAGITTLIWLASPVHYRRPLWVEQKDEPDPNGEIQDEWKEGTP